MAEKQEARRHPMELHQFLINRNGEVVDRFASGYNMNMVKQAIEAELEKP